MVEQPDWNDEEEKDDESDDERYEGVDAASGEVADVRVKRLGRSLLD